jgi:hypothetical protein
LILKAGRILAQGMMTYTAPGASVDLTLTAAVDIKVKKSDKEIGRVPKVHRWRGVDLQRIDLEGVIELSNFRGQAVEVEVTRHVLGNIDHVGAEGRAQRVNLLEDEDAYLPAAYPYPYWWGWYSWPDWWRHFNGMGRLTWTVRIEPGKTVELPYKWHYFWHG